MSSGSAFPDGQDDLPGIDTSVPHTARIWNYWLGGKDFFPADRAAGERISEVMPEIGGTARAVRAFLARAVRYLAREAGIRQYLDIGTGLPTVNNTHDVAQSIAPESRIVYVDNDPLVLVHARALLTSAPQGVTDYIDADLRNPDQILRQAARTLDLTQPVALMILGVLNHIMDDDEAFAIVDRLVDALCPGSHLVISHFTSLIDTEVVEKGMRIYNDSGGTPPVRGRGRPELLRFFEGLELLEPGLVSCSRWRPEHGGPGRPREVYEFCGVGRKPAPPPRTPWPGRGA